MVEYSEMLTDKVDHGNVYSRHKPLLDCGPSSCLLKRDTMDLKGTTCYKTSPQKVRSTVRHSPLETSRPLARQDVSTRLGVSVDLTLGRKWVHPDHTAATLPAMWSGCFNQAAAGLHGEVADLHSGKGLISVAGEFSEQRSTHWRNLKEQVKRGGNTVIQDSSLIIWSTQPV